jgi:hypothetical protein
LLLYKGGPNKIKIWKKRALSRHKAFSSMNIFTGVNDDIPGAVSSIRNNWTMTQKTSK